MITLKVVAWNAEWMNDLFDQNGDYYPDNHKPQHSSSTTVKRRREDLSGVINELAPDVIVIAEGPNTLKELKLFFDTDVSGTWQTFVQPSKGSSQCIGCAVRTDVGKLDAAEPARWFDSSLLTEFQPFELENEQDGIIEKYTFERMPVYLNLKLINGKEFRVLGLHLKSKGIFSAYEWSAWWAIADANRKKILAQASQIRQKFLDKYLSEAETQNIPLLVCGDINDGPGMDASEKKLLGSGIERIMGSVWHPHLNLGNALFDQLSPADRKKLNFAKIYTTTFKDPIFNSMYHQEWIDHILYTRQISGWVTDAKVHIEMNDGAKIWTKYKYASDHMPISVNVNL